MFAGPSFGDYDMELMAFGAGMGAMYILCGLWIRDAINENIPSEWGSAKVGILESVFWPIIIYGGSKDDE